MMDLSKCFNALLLLFLFIPCSSGLKTKQRLLLRPCLSESILFSFPPVHRQQMSLFYALHLARLATATQRYRCA